jgi:hypothetical protein
MCKIFSKIPVPTAKRYEWWQISNALHFKHISTIFVVQCAGKKDCIDIEKLIGGIGN